MKKIVTTILLVLILIIALFPIKMHYKDGGSVAYQSLIGIYRVVDWHMTLSPAEDGVERYRDGLSIEIFGQEIFNNMLSIPAE